MNPTPSPDRPYQLPANQVPVYYAGGERIARFRGAAVGEGPEDWVGSLSALLPELLPPGAPLTTGCSPLPDGTLLTEAVAGDPAGWLGTDLSAELGPDPGLLVKLLDAGERLPVHCHPTRELAARHLGSRFGKTEAWLILEAEADAAIWLGFREAVSSEQLRAWIEAQDIDAMLAAMNELPVQAGDVYYVPAGMPHAIGAGILLIELQEPTSFSVLAEYATFGLDEDQATLGLGWDAAVECFDRRGHGDGGLDALRPAKELVDDAGGHLWRLFPTDVEPFFQAYRAEAREALRLGPPSFQLLIAERGAGRLEWNGGACDIRAGETWLVPYGAGPLTLGGDVTVTVCLPPRPSTGG